MGFRIVQAAFKARLFEQFDRELRELRKKGKLPDEFSGIFRGPGGPDVTSALTLEG